jgi:hypothetical protein
MIIYVYWLENMMRLFCNIAKIMNKQPHVYNYKNIKQVLKLNYKQYFND